MSHVTHAWMSHVMHTQTPGEATENSWSVEAISPNCPQTQKGIPYVTWLIHMCVSDAAYLPANSERYLCVPGLNSTCAMPDSYVWHDSFIGVTWPVHRCDMTHSYARCDLFICLTWLIHISATWLIYKCAMNHSYVRRDSFVRVT